MQRVELIPVPPPEYTIHLGPHNVLVAFHLNKIPMYLDERDMRWKPLDRHISEVAKDAGKTD